MRTLSPSPIVLDTKPYVAHLVQHPDGSLGGTRVERTFVNPEPVNFYLHSCEIWAGLQVGGIADLSGYVFLQGKRVASFQWDHYAEPTGPHQWKSTFAHPYVLPPEGVLRLVSVCVPMGSGGVPRQVEPLWAHHMAWLEWTR
jgi:hypothetical protein